VIVNGWPVWVFAALGRGWQVALVVFKDSEWAPLIKRLSPNSVVEPYGVCEDRLGAAVNIQVWLSDVDPPRRLRVFDSPAVTLVVCGRRARNIGIMGEVWDYQATLVAHSDVGGMTDGAWRIHVYTRKDAWRTEAVARLPGRDLLCAVDTKIQGMPCPAPPKVCHAQPRVKMVRPGLVRVDGLCPWGEERIKVVAPCVYSPTKWVRRHLTGEEMCKVRDVREDVLCHLGSKEIGLVCKSKTLIPEKVCWAVLNSVSPLDRTPYELEESGKRRKYTEGKTNDGGAEVARWGVLTKGSNDADRTGRNRSATKSDDAVVPIHLWDSVLNPEERSEVVRALDVIRSWVLRWCKRRLCREFLGWFWSTYPAEKKGGWNLNGALSSNNEARQDWNAGRECVKRYSGSTWWEWNDGSRPHFWRWPAEYKRAIRDGVSPWFRTKAPSWKVPQRGEKDLKVFQAVRSKLEKVKLLRYIQEGTVDSLTSYFAVPKGESDIRMVYDGTKSGLNDSLWAPWFALPTLESHLRFVGKDTYLGDIDIGDMFHNFVLHERVQKVAGIDITPFFPDEVAEEGKVKWLRWVRSAMGLRNSPYNAIQGVLFAEEVIKGNPLDSQNVFRWDVLDFNMPGDPNYEPGRPWLSKMRSEDRALACDMIVYVDDMRSGGNGWTEARLVNRTIAMRLNYLGLQEAARKRRDPSQEPGPWAGSVVGIEEGRVYVTVTPERWEKARNMVAWMQKGMGESDELEFKTLESYRGYLIYFSRTYPSCVPFLKGIHLTLDSWRPWRRDDGWKYTLSEIRTMLDEKGEGAGRALNHSGGKPPLRVKWVPRLRTDVQALMQLLDPELPPKRYILPRVGCKVVYGFGDASGSGFGSSFEVDGGITYIHGQWDEEHRSRSSNFRELANVVYALEQAHMQGVLNGSEVFLFTDNTTAEGAFFKGTSKWEHLFALIVRLHRLQMSGDVVLHLVHVAGSRMISQGTDGLSRGDPATQLGLNESFLHHIPLHLGVMERQQHAILPWVESWLNPGGEIMWLRPEDWYTKGHSENCCVWTPAPAIADVALEQLAKATHKRPHHTHLVIIPRLMTARWRKTLLKICDLFFTIPVGTCIWDISQHEPLNVGLSLPLCRHPPWKLRGTPMLVGVERQLREVSKDDPGWGRNILCQLLQQARMLDRMPDVMVRSLLRAP